MLNSSTQAVPYNVIYSRSRGTAYALLAAYYHQNSLEHDPFKVAEHQTVTVQIDSILSLSKSSWQVRWTEQALDRQGSRINTTHRRVCVACFSRLANPPSRTPSGCEPGARRVTMSSRAGFAAHRRGGRVVEGTRLLIWRTG